MADTKVASQNHAVVNEQAERFIASFSDLRKVLGAGFKHAHQQGFSTTQFMILGLVERTREGEPYTISSIAGKLGLEDRKSTRLNSSHTVISYAVFCLKKKKISRRSPRA